jgi:beta-galactosidase
LLQDVLGLAVEEWQPLGAGEDNALSVGGREVRCEKFCELLHLRGAEVLATYARGFFGGRPAVTRHQHGAGEAVYVATQPERGWLRELLGGLARGRGLAVPMQASPGVEIAVRCTGADEFLFVINHEAAEATVDFQHWSGTDLLAGARCEGATSLEPFGVRVLKRSRNV